MPDGTDTQTLTQDQLAGAIRKKFPGSYDKVPDDKLVQGWLKKYPQYGKRLGQTPQSAGPSASGAPPVGTGPSGSKLKDFDLGLQEGTSNAFGISLPDPNHPEKLKVSQVASQMIPQIKDQFVKSLKSWGPLAPADMLASFIENSASTVEKGTKEIWNAPDSRTRGHGVGLVLGSLGQLFAGGEAPTESELGKVGGAAKAADTLAKIHELSPKEAQAAIDAANKIPNRVIHPVAYGRAHMFRRGAEMAQQFEDARQTVKKEVDKHAGGVSQWIDKNAPLSIDAKNIKQTLQDAWKQAVMTKEKPTPTMSEIAKNPNNYWGWEQTKQLRTKLGEEFKDSSSPVQAVIGKLRSSMEQSLKDSAEKYGLEDSFNKYNDLQKKLDVYNDYVGDLTKAAREGGNEVAKIVTKNPMLYQTVVNNLHKYGLNAKDAVDFARHAKWLSEREGGFRGLWRAVYSSKSGMATAAAMYLATRKYMPSMMKGAAVGAAAKYFTDFYRAMQLDPEILKHEMKKYDLEGPSDFKPGKMPTGSTPPPGGNAAPVQNPKVPSSQAASAETTELPGISKEEKPVAKEKTPATTELPGVPKEPTVTKVAEGTHGTGRLADQSKARERVAKHEQTPGTARSQHYGERRTQIAEEKDKINKIATHGFDPSSMSRIDKEDALKLLGTEAQGDLKTLQKMLKNGRISEESYDDGLNSYIRLHAEKKLREESEQ